MKRRNQRGWRPQLVALTTACLLSSALMAQSPIGSEFRVSAENRTEQSFPDLQFDDRGGLWIVWLEFFGDFVTVDRVLARAFSPQGEPGPVLDLADSFDFKDDFAFILDPLVVPTHEGGIFLIYTQPVPHPPSTRFEVYGRRFDASGHALGEPVSLVPPSSDNRSPSGQAAALLPQGGFALMTNEYVCSLCPSLGIHARILSPEGSPVSPYFLVPRRVVGSQSIGARGLAADGQGNITMVWDNGNGEPFARDNSDIHTRRFSSAGDPISPELVVSTTTHGTQSAPSVAAAPDGDFVIVWQKRSSGRSLSAILGQRFSKTGKRLGPEFRVTEVHGKQEFVPVVAMDRFGNFVVVWQNWDYSGACRPVRARLYRRDGTPMGPEFPVGHEHAACGQSPKVAFGPNGIFAVTWYVDDGYDPELGHDILNVYAARFSVPPSL